MNYRKQKVLKDLADGLADALNQIPLPPGEISVRMTIDKDWKGDREIAVTFQDRPRKHCQVRRREPNPIDGHTLAELPFMRTKRVA